MYKISVRITSRGCIQLIVIFALLYNSLGKILYMQEAEFVCMYKNVTANLMVESVDRAITFYKDVLGFSVIASAPGQENELQFAILAKDELSLMVQERKSLIEEYPILSTDKVKPSISLYIRVNDFDALYKEIRSKYAIYTELHTTFYGAKEFAIADIDGYILTFTEHTELGDEIDG